jgi:ankyrin repeat protein
MGANVESLGHGGATPLYLATMGKDCEVMKILLEAKTDANAKARKGQTALSRVAAVGIRYFM